MVTPGGRPAKQVDGSSRRLQIPAMNALQSANRALRFVLEIAALVALGWAGYQVDGPAPLEIALAALLPLMAATAWALFGAPGSSRHLATGPRLLLELALFGGAALALWLAGRPGMALGFAVLSAANRALMFAWDQ